MTALHKAAEELKKEMKQWGLSVEKGKQHIEWDNTIYPVPREAPRKECRLRIRQLIKQAEVKHFKDTQEALL